MYVRWIALSCMSVIACGDNANQPQPDAAPEPDANVDAPPASDDVELVPVTGHCEQLWQIAGETDGQRFGSWVRTVDDIDRDGARDVLVLASYDVSSQLEVRSGRDGHQLAAFSVPDQILARPDLIGDVDHDGYWDIGARATVKPPPGPGSSQPPEGHAFVLSPRLGTRVLALSPVGGEDQFGYSFAQYAGRSGLGFLVGAPVSPTPTAPPGRVYAMSYAGDVLATVNSPTATPLFGQRVLQVQDIDSDGMGETLVSDPLRGSAINGAITVLRSTDGQVAWEYVGGDYEAIGDVVRSTRDIDGDTVSDVVLGIHNGVASGDEHEEASGRVTALGGATGGVVWSLGSRRLGEQLGFDVAVLDDIDGDFIPEVLASAPFPLNGPIVTLGGTGRLVIASGATGAVLVDVEAALRDPTQTSERFGASLDVLGDVNGDSRPDFVISAPGNGALGESTGIARPLSERGAVLALTCRP